MNKLQNRILLLSVMIAAVGLIGCGGGDDSGGANKQASGGSGASGGGLKRGGAGSDDGTGDDAGSKSAGAGAGGGASQPAAGFPAATASKPVAAAPPKDMTPPPGAWMDPFKPWFNTTPPPPPVLSLVDPVRIAATDTVGPTVEPGVEIQELPSRRVAGILNGNGVYALLEGNGEQQVVFPGTTLSDGYVVTAINARSVTLKKTIEHQTFTQVVPLTDAGSTQTASFSGSTGRTAPGGISGAGLGGKMGGLRGSGGLSGKGGGD